MTANAATSSPVAKIPQPRRKRRVIRWVLLTILVGGILWVSISDGPIAQEARELLGVKQDRTIIDSTFTVGAHTFRYYKFSLPETTVNASVVGQFKSTAESSTAGSGDDNSIEAYVLTESAFTAWRTGNATSSLYDSGNVAESAVYADIPSSAGVYYLVFSNKSSPITRKAVHARVGVHYKSWLPDWLRHRKSGFSK
jgi:hypothetical protein